VTRPVALLVGCVVLLGPAGAAWAEAETSSVTRWVGHQITRGQRNLPVLGDMKTRSDTWVVADVVRTPSSIELVERACRVRVVESPGAHISMPDAAVRQLPPVRTRYERRPGGGWQAGPWRAGWDAQDHDHDGHPGLTVTVEAPLCGGQLYVASDVLSLARAELQDGALVGELKVKLGQKILGAEGKCLSVLAADSQEKLWGTFAYVPVARDATCESLAREGWLDRTLAPLTERPPRP
jgi:hypothetical protein